MLTERFLLVRCSCFHKYLKALENMNNIKKKKTCLSRTYMYYMTVNVSEQHPSRKKSETTEKKEEIHIIELRSPVLKE